MEVDSADTNSSWIFYVKPIKHLLMPELPEVETVVRELNQALKHKPKLKAWVFHRKDLRDLIPQKKLKALIGEKVEKIERRAKYLLLYFKSGIVLSHLGMTGSWRFDKKTKTHDHVEMQFSDGKILIYHDHRRFGILDFADIAKIHEHDRLVHLGIEPLEKEFTGDWLKLKLKNQKRNIKAAIMDQELVVGVGNIYASEALFRAKIKPQRRAGSLALQEINNLVSEIKKVLQEAIDRGGSTIRDYVSLNQEGGFQNYHLVYDKKGKACVICSTPIREKKIAGRSTFWCHQCQK